MKAIALDMDGTVLNDRGELTGRLKTVFQRINDKGIKVIFATGRTQSEILSVTPKDVPLAGYVAASGMSVFIDDTLIKQSTLNENIVKTVLEDARENEVYYETYTASTPAETLKQDKAYTLRDFSLDTLDTLKEYEEILMQETVESKRQWVDTIDYSRILKIFFISKDLDKIDRWHDYLSEQQDKLNVVLYKTSRHNCEIMLAGEDKATGLKVLLDRYGIDFKDVHAFGDSMNDLAMFDACGRSTAVKGSNEDIINAADDVTEFTNDAYGIADYLEKHYLN